MGALPQRLPMVLTGSAKTRERDERRHACPIFYQIPELPPRTEIAVGFPELGPSRLTGDNIGCAKVKELTLRLGRLDAIAS
jgi:hypothetical protein